MTRGSLDKILAATDGSEDATLAVRAAAGLSGRAGAELHIVHVRQAVQPWLGITSYAYTQETLEEFAREYEKGTEQLMEQQASEAEAEGAEVAGTHLREGREAEEIAGLAGELDAGLVVLGSRGLGAVKRLVMGSTSEGVVSLAPCPVLVTRGGEGAWPPSRLVVGDDGSEEAGRAGEFALGIGRLFEASALLVTVYPPPLMPNPLTQIVPASQQVPEDLLKTGQESLNRRAAELEGVLGKRPEVRVAVGDPAAVIQEAAEEGEGPALVAVGSRGMGAVGRFVLGSVSTDLLRAVDSPVLVYRQPPSAGEGT